jgi:hypothetical protein
MQNREWHKTGKEYFTNKACYFERYDLSLFLDIEAKLRGRNGFRNNMVNLGEKKIELTYRSLYCVCLLHGWEPDTFLFTPRTASVASANWNVFQQNTERLRDTRARYVESSNYTRDALNAYERIWHCKEV